jgi:hypothetical protein
MDGTQNFTKTCVNGFLFIGVICFICLVAPAMVGVFMTVGSIQDELAAFKNSKLSWRMNVQGLEETIVLCVLFCFLLPFYVITGFGVKELRKELGYMKQVDPYQ